MFEMPIKHLNGKSEREVGYASLKFRRETRAFNIKVCIWYLKL
jgi:hypothetical protein